MDDQVARAVVDADRGESAHEHAGLTPAPVISLRSVKKTYFTATGEVIEVLKGVDLDIMAGSFNVIRGESGSGKTSILRILGMLDTDFEGDYSFAGDIIRKHSSWYLDELRSSNIGFIFQDGGLFEHLNVRENISLPVRLQGTAEERKALPDTIREMAPHFFTMDEIQRNLLSNRPTQVSGGQKQRAAIMRAVINRPAVILADEPTASLDESRKQEVLELLLALCESGHTVIVVSHDRVFYGSGRQLQLSGGGLSELVPGGNPQVGRLDVRKPKAGRSILFGWKPRAPISILIRQAARETFMRPYFLLLVLTALCVGVTQVGVFWSVIDGAKAYLQDAMTKGSRLNRLEFKPLLSDYTAENRFSKEDAIKTWANVEAIVARRSAIATLMNYKEKRAISYDVKMLVNNDPEYRLLDFVAGGPFTAGENQLEAIVPVSILPELFADGDSIAKDTKAYKDFIGRPITVLQRKYAPTGQIVSWIPIDIRVAGIVLYAEGGGPVLYLPATTLNVLDRYVIDKTGEVTLPLAGDPWSDEQRQMFTDAVPHELNKPPARLLSGGDQWSDMAEVARLADFPWQDKLQVYTTEIREIIPVFRQLSKLGYKPSSDIFDKNMKWVLDVQDIVWSIFLPLLLLIVGAVGLTVFSNIFTSAKLRQREFALWRILGMRRGDLVTTQVISTMLMVVAGAAAGLAVAHLLVSGAQSILAEQNPSGNFDKVFASISSFMIPLLVGSFVVGVLAAIYPSIRTAYADPAKVLQSQG